MKSHRTVSAVFVLLALAAGSAPAQLDFSLISARAGVIRTLTPDYSSSAEKRVSFYPEIEVGGRFFTPSVSWGVSWGYWYDGGGEYASYTDESHIVGVRFAFQPQVLIPHFLIPFKLSCGLAKHFISRTRIDNGVVIMDEPREMTRYYGDFQSTTFFAGAGLSFRLSDRIRLEAEATEHFPLSDTYLIDYAQEYRGAITLGVAYSL